MEYPEETITITKKGEREVRIFKEKGTYYIYTYRSLKNGKLLNKEKLVLVENGKIKKEFFIIPLKEKNKYLLLETEIKGKRKLWDEKNKRVIEI